MDLIKVEIEQLKQQIEVLDAIFLDFSKDYSSKKEVSYCESLKISIIEYLYYGKESVLHKLRYCKGKEE